MLAITGSTYVSCTRYRIQVQIFLKKANCSMHVGFEPRSRGTVPQVLSIRPTVAGTNRAAADYFQYNSDDNLHTSLSKRLLDAI